MSDQPFTVLSIAEANSLTDSDFDANYWFLIVENMNYQEISLNSDRTQISHPDFIPFRELALEVISDLKRRKNDIKACRVCAGYFDINKEDGIFGDAENLKNFICQTCSNTISARAFYEKHMVM
ncbi:MAG: hypothetical protein HQL54_06750 [Magnetococcales bacterium]|nr:hypothetical protein [Magnetococcales bacterium]